MFPEDDYDWSVFYNHVLIHAMMKT